MYQSTTSGFEFQSTPLFFGNIADDKLIDKMYQSMTPIMEEYEFEELPKKQLQFYAEKKCPRCNSIFCTINISDYIEVEYNQGEFMEIIKSYKQRCIECRHEWYVAKLPKGTEQQHLSQTIKVDKDESMCNFEDVILPIDCVRKIIVEWQKEEQNKPARPTDLELQKEEPARSKCKWCAIM